MKLKKKWIRKIRIFSLWLSWCVSEARWVQSQPASPVLLWLTLDDGSHYRCVRTARHATITPTRPCPVPPVSRSSGVTSHHTEVTLNHHHHAYSTLSSSTSLHVGRRDPRTREGHLDPLFDVRKYTHIVQITGNSTSAVSYIYTTRFTFQGYTLHLLKNFKSTWIRNLHIWYAFLCKFLFSCASFLHRIK